MSTASLVTLSARRYAEDPRGRGTSRRGLSRDSTRRQALRRGGQELVAPEGERACERGALYVDEPLVSKSCLCREKVNLLSNDLPTPERRRSASRQASRFVYRLREN